MMENPSQGLSGGPWLQSHSGDPWRFLNSKLTTAQIMYNLISAKKVNGFKNSNNRHNINETSAAKV